MKTLVALFISALAAGAAPRPVPPMPEKPKKVFVSPAMPVRPARVAFSKQPPPPPLVHARRINASGWEQSRISPQTLAALKVYPYVIVNGFVKWNTGTNSRFRIITKDLDGSWWDGFWTATFQNGQNVSIPVPTNSTWILVSP